MPTYKAPGVYITEIPVSGRWVVEVETAIPALIGYTEKTRDGSGNELFWMASFLMMNL